MRIDLAIMIGAFVIATGVAALAGAINFGTALTFGQIAFAIAAVAVIVRRTGRPSRPSRPGRPRGPDA